MAALPWGRDSSLSLISLLLHCLLMLATCTGTFLCCIKDGNGQGQDLLTRSMYRRAQLNRASNAVACFW